MPQKGNEKVILYDEKKRNGYIIKLKSFKGKEYKVVVKLMINGQVRSGALFYEWFPNHRQAKGLYRMACHTLKVNSGMGWDFNFHPISFLLHHRN